MFWLICHHEPCDEILEPDIDGNYPVEYGDYVWKRNHKIVVVSIARCLHSSYKPMNVRIVEYDELLRR